MNDYASLYRHMEQTPLADWGRVLPSQVEGALSKRHHGDLSRWLELIRQLPELPSGRAWLDQDCITVGAVEVSEEQRRLIADLLRGLHPWRKGPFCIHGVHIDAEWRCDRKWDRLRGAIAPLNGRLVLDVGCGNGYYAWRIVGAGAQLVVGVDPSLRYVCQYLALRRFLGDQPAYVLPLTLEDVPADLRTFDTVFSMGVLYHRRSPFDHLFKLRECLRPGGELVLETLVIEGGQGRVLVPQGRYAQMRNVWFIPSPETLLTWLRRSGFRQVRLADIAATSTDEQRSTDWMRFHSLADFLDPGHPGRTVEGLPAPIRAIVLAQTPSD
jgi:tRNA (mo5U34)-methyltransferase